MPIHAQWLLFVGPGKTGTSWIDRVLRRTGGVCLPAKVKETFFFDRNFARGRDWYFHQFPSGRGGLRVEVAPTYFYAQDAPNRIRDTLPNVKIVVTLRDPVQRAISHYLNLRKYGRTALDIEDALEAFPGLIRQSLYVDRLAQWTETFGDVRVVFYEDVIGRVESLFRDAIPEVKQQPISNPGRVNGASVPRLRLASRVGQFAAKTFRRAGLHRVVDMGKQAGLKKVLFSGGTLPAKETLEEALQPWGPAFADDQAALARLLGKHPPWQRLN